MPEIEFLEFDSSLFGYQVGSVNLPAKPILSDIRKGTEGFRLIYIFTKEILDSGSETEFPANLVDVKIGWQKELEDNKIRLVQRIEQYDNSDHIDLRKLALKSGIYSRFNIDKSFENNEYEKLYGLWIEKIIQRELADEIFVFTEENRIRGFVSVQVVNEIARIGLIAVDESVRGKSVATSLMQAAELWAFDHGAKCMQVSTQKANAPAMSLYEKSGYHIMSEDYIYHLWI